MSKFDSRPDKMKEYGAIKFVTLSLPLVLDCPKARACFNIYRELFYNSEGKKIIPENLEELLTARGLAYPWSWPSQGQGLPC
jgi:LAGLIDADG DNA endonuclease family